MMCDVSPWTLAGSFDAGKRDSAGRRTLILFARRWAWHWYKMCSF